MSESSYNSKKKNGTRSISTASVASETTEEMFQIDRRSDTRQSRTITFAEVEIASRAMTSGVNRSMSIQSKVGPLVGMDELWVNLAYEQLSGSVKERAARYVIYRLNEEQKKKGIVTASRGCFAKGLCHQGYIQNCPIVVFMPIGTAQSTTEFCKKLRGTIIIEGNNLEETKQKAMSYSKENGILYVDTHDYPDVIAALGTVAIEILEEINEPDVIIVPTGGGGLLAGTSITSKHMSPKTKIYAAESETSPAWSSAMEAGRPVSHARDRLFHPVGLNSFITARNLVDKCIIVEEKWIAAAMLLFMEQDKIVLAGESCIGLAAILSKKCKHFCGKRVVCILPTANIEVPQFMASMERGLVVLGRLARITITVKDEPNALPQLVKQLNDRDYRIRSITQEREFLIDDLGTVSIKCICETNGVDHVKKLRTEFSRIYGDKFRLEAREAESSCSGGRCRGK